MCIDSGMDDNDNDSNDMWVIVLLSFKIPSLFLSASVSLVPH